MSKKIYSIKDSRITGGLTEPANNEVIFKKVFKKKDSFVLGLLGVSIALINIGFMVWLLNPAHLAGSTSQVIATIAIICFILIIIIEMVRIIQAVTLWLFAKNAVDPVPMKPQDSLRVAVLTTIVPSKEPIYIIRQTLEAMKKIRHKGIVDVWILDEGDSTEVKEMAAELGVRHFSRKGIDKYNQPSGEFKTKSKAGNHNSWRAEHEDDYDVVAQMDPDHIPYSNFLERTLGYFRDPNVGFVVAPQVYGNQSERWLTRASAAQAYIFHAIIQRGGNGFGSPLLIGTNHLYRPGTWQQIGGYQDSIIEDHLTSMKLHGTPNPATGKKWRSVYTPDIVSVGEGPTSWTDYFNQQKRWAYGIWEILLKHSFGLHRRLTLKQKVSYAALQFFYPSVGVVWILGTFVASMYYVLGISSMTIDAMTWLAFWSLSLLSQIFLFIWLNRFNLNKHERSHGGLDAMALTLLTSPVYVAAGLAALTRRPLAYAVTAKGDLSSPDTFATYRSHIIWIVIASTLLFIGLYNQYVNNAQLAWSAFILTVAITPVLFFVLTSRKAFLGKFTSRVNRPVFLNRQYVMDTIIGVNIDR